jgi:carboxylesterase type B
MTDIDIDGGYLQFGGANEVNPVALLSEASFDAIIVMPAYRLNVYGFLASHELLNDPKNRSGTVGNLGFWDQRLALQFTYTNISYFGGNPSSITVAGYSAGAHSVFYQLAYDLDYPPQKRIIKRAIMHANGPGVQPKALQEHQEHFDELLSVLRISNSLPASEKLRLLRETSPVEFRKAIRKMKLHEIRAVTDGHFVKTNLFQELNDGTFAKKMLASNVQILIGESANEHFSYSQHRAPKANADAVYQRLLADYP